MVGSGIQDNNTFWTTRRFGLVLALLICVSFPRILLGIESFVFRDYSLFGYPLAHYYRECFWSGEIPLWNPFNNSGLPFLAQWNTMVCYPLSLIYLLLPLPWSLGMFCLVHLFLAGMGMFCLARTWTNNSFVAAMAGVAFAFSGVTLSCLIWPAMTAALAWSPWVLWAVPKAWSSGSKHIVHAAVISALQMLAGGPEVFLFTWITLLALFLCELGNDRASLFPKLKRISCCCLLFLGLVAVQLFHFWIFCCILSAIVRLEERAGPCLRGVGPIYWFLSFTRIEHPRACMSNLTRDGFHRTILELEFLPLPS